jgi:hypothetical protein
MWPSKFKRKACAMRLKFLVLAWFLAVSVGARADELHFNKLEIKKKSNTELILEIQISSLDVFKTLLTGQAPNTDFCETLSKTSQTSFDRLLATGLKKLGADAYFEIPGLQKLKLRNISAANYFRARETLQQNCLLQQFPLAMRPHLPAIEVNAIVSSANPLQRAQISMPALLYPLMVRYGADQFWLTEQISTAVLDF